ncbi:uncharacterized protein BP01DRAFT_421952 [Aspergillus saccharolyticus JOP 1030-1]|uniref:ER transporter 6TM N-terminal domain-containing protein n=1 Tax=Aspergillus saccharolyticus JOP 1030-1 TaxID=1450539 RepID=A0A318ZSX2_9EURO|nr:hypothetical protein BP01DRAFT_421952 [Aspergillus saccharolyticus JOP 1030-1]PYH47060.1 hypothetical protein BP01DRAFT_421952 [Aspergillus saccharolyticus JOP 1030-1]
MGETNEPPRDDGKTINALQERVLSGGKKRLPPFLDHFNARDLKILFRCWVAAWVACLLFVISPSLSSLGQATFFACLVSLILPPSSVIFIHLLGAISLYLGVCLAWAWGVITMKAAYAARPSADTQAQLLALEQTAAQQANATGQSVASLAQILVYEGHMLDARVTAVTYCLICTFIYFMARLRASNPKATFTAIFGTIISDLFLIYIPLLPSFNGTLPLTLAKPAGVGIGLGFACSVLFFPQSTSRVILNGMEEIIELLTHPLAFTMETLGKRDPDLDMALLRQTQIRIIGEYRKAEPALAFLPLDFSIGCWGAQHVGALKEPIRQAIGATLSLLEFHMNRLSGKARAKEVLLKYVDQIEAKDEKVKGSREVGRHQLQEMARMLDGLRNSDTEPIPEETLQAFVSTASKAIEACVVALHAAKDCIHMVNSRPWYRRPSPESRDELCQRSRKALDNLRMVRQTFITNTTETLVGWYGPLMDGTPREDSDRHAKNFSGIVVGLVFEEHMGNAMDKTEVLLDQVLNIFHSAQRTRVWWPLSLKAFGSWVSGKGNKAPTMTQVSDEDPEEQPDATQSVQERLRLSRGYRVKRRSAIGRAILGIYHWFTCNEGLYAMRMVVVTIAIGIVSALPSTAGFFYREKGLWALIMAQTGLMPYMADFIFSVIARVVGTIVGGLLGLLAWYIGSGNGPGSPYGLAAVMAVMLVIFLWCRLYSPPSLLQGSIMGCATFLLVVAYSFDDTHVPTYGNPGVGYTVFWRRLLLVLIGIGAGTIVQLFPHPPSAAKHISKTLSTSIRAISDQYALLLSCWAQGQKDGRLLAEPIALQMAQSLVLLDGPIQLLRYEFSSSRFDSASMDQVKLLCHALNRNLGRLLALSASLPQEYQDRLARMTGLLDHRCIGEVMAVLSVCEQALKTGDAPPELLPTPLLQRSMEYWHAHAMDTLLSAEMLRDEHYRRYCVGVSAYVKFLGTVDELVLVVKGVLGESHLVSWEQQEV